MSKEKPDNSKEFFSARKPESRVLGFQFNYEAKKDVGHPWRYFVAAGESLARLEEFKQDALNYKADMQALAASVGAEASEHGRFTFKDTEIVEVPQSLRLKHKGPFGLASNFDKPGDFFLEPGNGWFEGVKKRIAEIEALPADKAEAARAELAVEVRADSFDGKFFHFNNWNSQVDAVQYPREPLFRLKSNPAFVRNKWDTGFTPDLETDEGYKLKQKLDELSSHFDPNYRFGKWLEQFKLDIAYYSNGPDRDAKHPEVEIIGKEWIIKVPVVTEGIYGADGKGGEKNGEKEGWILPPGAVPLKVSEYFAKVEETGSLRALPKAGVTKRS